MRLILLIAIIAFASDPVVFNVRALQQSDSGFVEVYFNVKDEDNTEIHTTLEASSDNGETWDIPVITVTGDTGKISVGEDKKIVWNINKDWPEQFSTCFRVRLIARDKFCPEIGDEGMIYIDGKTIRRNNMDTLVRPFCIDSWEYPNKRGELPLTDVSWIEASNICRKSGKRLCTEIQWEVACMGKFPHTYPYGNNYQRGKCNADSYSLNRIGDNISCVSSYGVYDMSGNVFEWTADNYSSDENFKDKKVIRGGNFYLGKEASRCTAKQWEWQNNKSRHTGFRCCGNF